MRQKKLKSQFLFGVLLLLFVAGLAFVFGYQVRGKVTPQQEIQKPPTVLPTVTPLFQRDRTEQAEEMNQQQIKRQFMEDELPLLPDLQQVLRNQNVEMVSLHTLNSGKVIYIVESTVTSNALDTEQTHIGEKNYYLVNSPTWQILEENMSKECEMRKVENFFQSADFLSKDMSSTQMRLLYQVECEKNAQVGLLDLNTGKKLKIHGRSLPNWLSESITPNYSFLGELTDLVGYGSNQVFEVKLAAGSTGSFRQPNRVVINGMTGEIVDWLDYDKYAGSLPSISEFGSTR